MLVPSLAAIVAFFFQNKLDWPPPAFLLHTHQALTSPTQPRSAHSRSSARAGSHPVSQRGCSGTVHVGGRSMESRQ